MIIILKWVAYGLLGFIGFVVLYLCFAWLLSRIGTDPEPDSQPEIAIYVKTNGVHTDLVLPIRSDELDWSRLIPFRNIRSADTSFSYIAFGWGDKGFYLETPEWSDLKASIAFKAAFGLSSSAMHVTYYHQLKEDERCVRLLISKQQHKHLLEYINSSLQYDSAGSPLPVATAVRYGKTDAFYEAKGRYSLFHTCNTWANSGLKAAGQRACLWTAFDKGIFYQLKR